jgi:hypothetical protein
MGALLVVRALATAVAERNSEEAPLLTSLSSVVLVAPALQLRPVFESVAATWGWGQLKEMVEFSDFRSMLNRDLRILQQESPETFVQLFVDRTIFILASDDRIVNNGALRSQFKGARFWELPGSHTEVLKADSPVHETFRVLARILGARSPEQLVRLPLRLEATVNFDTGEVSDDHLVIPATQIATSIVFSGRKRGRIDSVEVMTSMPAHGVLADVYKRIRGDIDSDEEWIVRLVREPIGGLIANGGELLIFANGVLFKRIPFVVRGRNDGAYQSIAASESPDVRELRGSRVGVRSWGQAKVATTDLVHKLLNIDAHDPAGKLALAPAMTRVFLEYAVGVNSCVALHAYAQDLPDSPRRPAMVLKWLGICSIASGNLERGYEYFRDLAQVDNVGVIYGAFALAKLGRLDEARRALQSARKVTHEYTSLREAAEQVFGGETVRAVEGESQSLDQ